MKRIFRQPARLTAASLALLGIAAGCSPQVLFNSPGALGQGVEGKAWQPPYFVDTALYVPEALAISTQTSSGAPGADGALATDFRVATSGSQLQLVGSWWDPSSATTYRGYARLYTDGVGWSGIGPNFQEIANPTPGFTFDSVFAAAGAGGLFLAAFLDTDDIGSAAAYTGAQWENPVTTILTAAPQAERTSAVVDSLGRGFLFFGTGTAIMETQWSLTGGLSSPLKVVTGAAISTDQVNSVFDGVNQVCVAYRTTASGLAINCQNVSLGGPYTFATATPLAAATVAGYSMSTDGAGNILVAYYQGSGTTFHIFATIGTAGVFTAPVQIDAVGANPATMSGDALNDGFTTQFRDPALWPGIHPSVMYVGNGAFLVVWTGFNNPAVTGATQGLTQLYSIEYDPNNGGWQPPVAPGEESLAGSLQAIPGTLDFYNLVPHPQQIAGLYNRYGNGNAGIAINYLFTTDPESSNTAAVQADVFSPYPEGAEARTLFVDRWQVEDGWLTPTNFAPLTSQVTATLVSPTQGFVCYNQVSTGSVSGAIPGQAMPGSGAGLDCTHSPVGAILPSGDTVVLFEAQDNYAQAATSSIDIPGNRRVACVEFK